MNDKVDQQLNELTSPHAGPDSLVAVKATAEEIAEQENLVKRRRVPRREYRKKVGILVHGEYEVADAYEIGERGMLVTCSKVLVEGERLVLTFHVPGLVHAVVQGVIRYVMVSEDQTQPPKFGIEFESIDFNDKRQIRYYVASSQRKVS